jgi:methionyl-tRNA formyltransferase
VRIVFLTTDDPLYLPELFRRVLAERGRDTEAVYVVPPLYKNQTTLQAARRYRRTFGTGDTLRLARRTAGAKLRRRSIAAVCARAGVQCSAVRDVNDPAFVERLRRTAPDVLVSVSCPQIFKQPLLEVASKGCLNVHGALLPHYRGVMPSFWMLANGEERAGVSVYFVNEQIDAGELCGQRAFDISPDDTLASFLQRSKGVAAELLLEVLDRVDEGTVTREPLDLAQGSYYSWPEPGAVRRFRAAGRRVW